MHKVTKMRLAPRICTQYRNDFAESYSVRILFAFIRIHTGRLTHSILFPVKNLLVNYFSERQSMEQNADTMDFFSSRMLCK